MEPLSKRGANSSTPSRDQVPELRNAQCSPSAGTAATAASVSWEQVAKSGNVPSSASRFGVTFPIRVPETTTGGNRDGGNPSSFTSTADHSFKTGLKICVVLAKLRSISGSPLNK